MFHDIPSPDHTITLKLDQTVKRLGGHDGRMVFAVETIAAESDIHGLPSLVIKTLGHRSEGNALEREAYVYEHLQALQGFNIPICYGRFQGRLDQNAPTNTKRGLFDIWEEGDVLEILVLERLGDRVFKLPQDGDRLVLSEK